MEQMTIEEYRKRQIIRTTIWRSNNKDKVRDYERIRKARKYEDLEYRTILLERMRVHRINRLARKNETC